MLSRGCLVLLGVPISAFASRDGAYQASIDDIGSSWDVIMGFIAFIVIWFMSVALWNTAKSIWNAAWQAKWRRDARIEAEIYKNNIWTFVIDFATDTSLGHRYTVDCRTKGIRKPKKKMLLHYKDRESVIDCIQKIKMTRENRGDDLGYAVQDKTGEFPDDVLNA